MSQYQGIFKRYEKKYLLDDQQYHQLRQRLSERMIPDQYGKSTICNIYFDTPNYHLIRRSIEKPVYKEKLRLRSYGVPREDSTVFIELKKKYKGVVYKRRVDTSLAQAVRYLYLGETLLKPSQITKEIDWFIYHYQKIVPAIFISYDRVAQYNKENNDLRITFDSNILWREETLDLSKGAWGNELLLSNQKIMEIKIPGAMPVWLADLLNDLRIYPCSYSKYGNAYKTKFIKENKLQGGFYCA
jgi:SPX domain protein involved in polyphosphate accumulation